jgi:hypothetical protein
MEKVFEVADAYMNSSFTYNDVESACGRIGEEYNRSRMSVLEDFEIACDEIQKEE